MFQEHRRDVAAVVLVEPVAAVAHPYRVVLAVVVDRMASEEMDGLLIIMLVKHKVNQGHRVVQEVQDMAVVPVSQEQVARQVGKVLAQQEVRRAVVVVVQAVPLVQRLLQSGVPALADMLVLKETQVVVERKVGRALPEIMDHQAVMV